MIEILSIDLTNHCSKQCEFCYNKSHLRGSTEWTKDEVTVFAEDCIRNGVKAISLGGGEPFEFPEIFDVIDNLSTQAFVSVTSNGLPLNDPSIFAQLIESCPDKIHITIHYPDRKTEVDRVIRLIHHISTQTKAIAGVNLLVNKEKIESCREVYIQLTNILSQKDIIIVPQRYGGTPSPHDLAYITGGRPFQSPSCLLKCKAPENFCSVSWDKKVNYCSFAGGKVALPSLDYAGLTNALKEVQFESCGLK